MRGLARAAPLQKGRAMRSILFFESMITPRLITVLYWLLLLAAAAGGIATMQGLGAFGFAGIAAGLAVTAGGALGARLACELLLVLFKIHESMETLSRRL
jgi:Domain of unknown function (DUF4282)